MAFKTRAFADYDLQRPQAERPYNSSRTHPKHNGSLGDSAPTKPYRKQPADRSGIQRTAQRNHTFRKTCCIRNGSVSYASRQKGLHTVHVYGYSARIDAATVSTSPSRNSSTVPWPERFKKMSVRTKRIPVEISHYRRQKKSRIINAASCHAQETVFSAVVVSPDRQIDSRADFPGCTSSTHSVPSGTPSEVFNRAPAWNRRPGAPVTSRYSSRTGAFLDRVSCPCSSWTAAPRSRWHRQSSLHASSNPAATEKYKCKILLGP